MQLTLEDCRNFSTISGDFNPLHNDVEYSRRTPFGSPVIHGIHIVLLGIAQHHLELAPMLRHSKKIKLKVDFFSVVSVAEEFVFDLSLQGLRAEITCEEPSTSSVMTKITLISDPEPEDIASIHSAAVGGGAVQEVFRHTDARVIKDQSWANAVSVLGCNSVELLLNITRLVGMKYPGERALFKGFEIEVGHRCPALIIEQTFFDARFQFYKYTILDVGQLQVYGRPEATDYENVNVECDVPDCLTEAKRIVIFGVSSGLGFGLALSALNKGIDVVGFSRSHKSTGIQRLLINKRFRHIECDIEKLKSVNSVWGIENIPVFYFCTPSVRLGKRKSFNEILFERYVRYYVRVPELIVEQARPSIFIQPSSSAVVDRPSDMREYSSAKSAQEEWVSQYKGDTQMTCTRLPAVATDQNNITGTIKRISIVDALNMMMDELPVMTVPR